ncbi:MAG: hypothetical protein ABIO38_00785 [Luteimonas sp.]
MLIKFTIGLLLGLSSVSAIAQQTHVDIEQRLTAEQLHATGLDTLSPAQLELLNRLLREDSAGAATMEQSPREDAPRDESGRSYIGLEDKPINSRLKGSISGWEPGTVFDLENGQQWKVLKGTMKLRKSLQAPEIVVVPGVAGRWFLQVDPDMPKARVYRID